MKRMLLKSIRSVMSWHQGSNPRASALNATDKALAYELEPISGRRNPLYHEGRRQQDDGTRVVAEIYGGVVQMA